MVFNFFLLAILFYHVLFFLFIIIDLKFLILKVTTQILNPTAELTIPIGISPNVAKAELRHIK